MYLRSILVVLVLALTTTLSTDDVHPTQLFVELVELVTLIDDGPPKTKEEKNKLIRNGVKLIADSISYGIASHSTKKDDIYLHYIKFLEDRNKGLMAELVKLEVTTKENCPAPDSTLVSTKNRELIRAAINQYDADKTGRPDLALESSGGSVVSTRCTKKSDFGGPYVSILGYPFFWPNSPRRVIQPGGMKPGDCWSFDGAEGFIVLKLVAPTNVTGFTLEHLPKSISPLGHIDSAPKKFKVVGLTDYGDLSTEFLFGEFQYDDNSIPIQYFEVQNSSDTYFPYVELKILSNHGNLNYTCLYRFRVHGNLESGLTILRI